MFVRYLGGGIGHLEQFPPANNDDEDVATYEDVEEVDNDNFIRGPERVGAASEVDDTDGNNHLEGENEGGDTEEDEETEEEDDSDPGESSDEEVGNVY